MEGNGNIPYFRYALERYMRCHGLEACDPCSLPAYILSGLLREAKERARAARRVAGSATTSDPRGVA